MFCGTFNPKIDLLVVFHNNRAMIPDFLKGIRRISIPITAYFLDNDSRDGTADLLAESALSLPFRTYVLRSSRNNGFARGMNLLARQGRAEFMFLLNPDTEMESGCLETLLSRAQSDPRAAICEARQVPVEAWKAWDAATGETTWCSGAAALVRREAFEALGGFDDHLYFMYCEDVDLSWRCWLKGWKCLYVPDAVIRHFTGGVLAGKPRTMENYFAFRNSLFLLYRFGTAKDRGVLGSYLRRRFLSRGYSIKSKLLFAIALMDYCRYVPSLLDSRNGLGSRDHNWIRLMETSLSR